MKLLRNFKLFLACVVALLAVGCETSSKQAQVTPVITDTEQSHYEALLSKARATQDQQQRSGLFLEASQTLFDNGLSTQANYALSQIEPIFLIGTQLNKYQILALELSLAGEDSALIRARLEAVQLDQLLMSPLGEQQQLVTLLTIAHERLNQPLDAAILLAEHEGIFTYDDSNTINERVWALLQQTSTDKLMLFKYQGSDDRVSAWLELAKSIKLTQASLDEQYASLNAWLTAHPQHPATLNLPLELMLLSQLPNTSPNQIVLALPLSGPYTDVGQAVSDGFLANFFSNRSSEHSSKIRLFDTNSAPISELYKQLEQTRTLGNNTLVVGPLAKSNIIELSESDYLTTPTLALNQSDEIKAHPMLDLFGLDPSDETKQVAEAIASEGLFRAAIIAPDTSWGQRLSKTFSEQFSQVHGHVVATSLFENQKDLANTVSELLATKQSKERSRKIMGITRQRLETEPRRRQDIDAIFMLADNETAKQIKPMLAFNFARNVPVFAISQSHDPFTRDENSDLNGVRFVDIPWMFSSTSPLRSQIESNIGLHAERYARFYALGADAYTLAPRLQLMSEIENSYVQGYTGTLSMGEHGKIKRSLQWAKFSRGSVKILN